MLPSPSELRELSERIRAAVAKARTREMRQLLAGHAFRLAQVAEQLERETTTLDPLLRRANIKRYERLLADALDERTRRTIEALSNEESAELAKQRSQFRAWRRRAAELRATADQFEDLAAQAALRRAADNLDKMAEHAEALAMSLPRAPGKETG